ncbi:hypothetical protein BD311DRAFT_756891 [Dichomitus squalens]|uniref:Uncharacterized protein n=1 Tax=Dichomitus squalens TaxID=114155 RepID=A0A4Q9MNL0_9APHY|nr:hypothetical protein BD311DRAFT_756891 [Dichomitus squalens]
MCYLRQICYVYESCGHVYPMPDQQITCDSPRCKFSPTHPKNCHGASCKQTCKQFRQHPQQYSPQMAGFCPGCAKSR